MPNIFDPMPQIPTPIIVPEVPGGSGGVQVNPATGQIEPTSPDSPVMPSQAPTVQAATGGTGAFDLAALKWLGALVLLWIILTALTEASPNAQMFGKALAGLVLLGALFYLGPGAISNVKNVWGQTGPTPTAGPNPVPGA